MPEYQIHISEDTLDKVKAYQQALIAGKVSMGELLQQTLNNKNINKDIKKLSIEEFLEIIIQSKKPFIFAESHVKADGSDWNATELSILGDVNFSVPVTIYDNGKWKPETGDKPHAKPFQGHLLFTPGALLANPNSPDRIVVDEKSIGGPRINKDEYYKLYERRLLPLLIHANNTAAANGKKAFITLPCLGGGAFGGEFKYKLGKEFQDVLQRLITQHGDKLKNIQGIHYDPYSAEYKNDDLTIKGIDLRVRPLLNAANQGKQTPQLCNPNEYDSKYKKCEFFSMVAWDHVSWPGNDFYRGSRNTDDGAKAAATDVMAKMTGVKAKYDNKKMQYDPPKPYQTWEQAALKATCMQRTTYKLSNWMAAYNRLPHSLKHQHSHPPNHPQINNPAMKRNCS